MIHKNASTEFCRMEYMPEIHESALIHPVACVIGHVFIGKNVMVSPFACIRGDEGHPIIIGDDSNIQDGVIIHGLETEHGGRPLEENRMEAGGKKASVHVGRRVSVAHQAQLHGPVCIGNDTFIGMKTLLFKARIGNNCVVEPGSVVIGVTVDDGRYVPAGTVLKDQKKADNLPRIREGYPFKELNRNVIRVNTGLAEGYKRMDLSSPGLTRGAPDVEKD